MDTQDSDFTDGLIGEIPSHIRPLLKKFEPWHKVRKQFIRKNQWNKLITRMVQSAWREELLATPLVAIASAQGQSDASYIRPLRCLFIPGDDLLDIRSLWSEIHRLNCHIRYLGFNAGQGSSEIDTRVHIANNAITSLEGVVSDSHVQRDRFEAISSLRSPAYLNLKEYGPFHVVNLDICGSLFPNTERGPKAYYSAIHQLLNYQFAHQSSPWLLFLTTTVEPEKIDGEEFQNLCGPVTLNARQYAEFAERVASFVPADAYTDDGRNIDLSKVDQVNYCRLFGVALGKWLLSFCGQGPAKWQLMMRGSFRYSINEFTSTTMLSLAFEFKPRATPLHDITGMSNLHLPTVPQLSELECAIRIVEKVNSIVDVDERLDNDIPLKNEILEESATLLASAGFDKAAYLAWVASGEASE